MFVSFTLQCIVAKNIIGRTKQPPLVNKFKISHKYGPTWKHNLFWIFFYQPGEEQSMFFSSSERKDK